MWIPWQNQKKPWAHKMGFFFLDLHTLQLQTTEHCLVLLQTRTGRAVKTELKWGFRSLSYFFVYSFCTFSIIECTINRDCNIFNMWDWSISTFDNLSLRWCLLYPCIHNVPIHCPAIWGVCIASNIAIGQKPHMYKTYFSGHEDCVFKQLECCLVKVRSSF